MLPPDPRRQRRRIPSPSRAQFPAQVYNPLEQQIRPPLESIQVPSLQPLDDPAPFHSRIPSYHPSPQIPSTFLTTHAPYPPSTLPRALASLSHATGPVACPVKHPQLTTGQRVARMALRATRDTTLSLLTRSCTPLRRRGKRTHKRRAPRFVSLGTRCQTSSRSKRLSTPPPSTHH